MSKYFARVAISPRKPKQRGQQTPRLIPGLSPVTPKPMPWMTSWKMRMQCLLKLVRTFSADQTASPVIEFALVGTTFFLILFFVIQGGLYYTRVTALDYATEVVARSLNINNNPGYNTAAAAPTTASAFATAIATNGLGLLKASNVAVSVKECNPITATVIISGGCFGGFGALTTKAFDNTNGTYQYYQGTCSANIYESVTTSGQLGISVIGSSCNGTCNTTGFTNSASQASGNVVNGTLSLTPATKPSKSTDGQSNPYTNANGTLRTQYNGALYTCSSGQDFLVQVQYTDSTFKFGVAILRSRHVDGRIPA